MVHKPLESQEGVVWLHDDVAFLRVGENAVRLYKLFRELIVQSL